MAAPKKSVEKESGQKANVSPPEFTRAQELAALRDMLLIRRFEEKAGQLYGMGAIGGFCHLYIGQEAVVVGMQMALKQGDQVITGYRDHGHMLACGMEANGVMAELTGRRGGYSKGKGGSMHMFSMEKALDSFKRRCEMWTELGLPVIYSTTATTIKPAPDDYKTAADNVREVARVAAQYKLIAAFEFVRQSTFASTLPTILSITRAANEPNLGPLFDFYHFWSGNNKLADMDMLRPGEIKHVHFQDVPDMPREMLDTTTRFIPGDGVSPIDSMLGKLAEKGYDGALSVELFLPRFADGDPLEVAREIKGKCEAVMRRAKVL
jgi:sugar phosphate isomerase/epimerase